MPVTFLLSTRAGPDISGSPFILQDIPGWRVAKNYFLTLLLGWPSHTAHGQAMLPMVLILAWPLAFMWCAENNQRRHCPLRSLAEKPCALLDSLCHILCRIWVVSSFCNVLHDRLHEDLGIIQKGLTLWMWEEML